MLGLAQACLCHQSGIHRGAYGFEALAETLRFRPVSLRVRMEKLWCIDRTIQAEDEEDEEEEEGEMPRVKEAPCV